MDDIIPITRKKTSYDENGDNKAACLLQEYASLSNTECANQFGNYLRRIQSIPSKYEGMDLLIGGPNHTRVVPLFNSLGSKYPNLEKKEKIVALTHCFNYFLLLNYKYSRELVENFHEPQFVADLAFNDRQLWCGEQSEKDFLKNHKSWEQVKERFGTTKSRFLLALAITQPRSSSLEVRTRFYSQHSYFLDQTLNGIATLVERFSRVYPHIPRKEYLREALSSYDAVLHDKIQHKMKEKPWIQLE